MSNKEDDIKNELSIDR